ncbi:hypothetical protein EW145_g1748 [Phellinidium pouzarii]|uniref:Hydrophobin n=1 Tax=Phellinidium pouzarii TaxID=167371 RepID=A0A4S4LIU4_9AGAM|nr:hypothetical protein EW145_g1748 [Phellinidium pouzarii]
MRVSSIISIAATAALSLVPTAFAAPFKAGAVADAGAGAVIHARIIDTQANKYGADVHARFAGADAVAPVSKRDVGCVSILTELKVNLGVHITALGNLNAQNATTEVITPILSGVVSVIGDAVVQLKGLNGCSDNVSDCAGVLAEILVSLCGVLGVVLSVVTDVQILLGVIVQVALGGCLCELISVVIGLMGGLLLELIPLVLVLAPTLLSLGLGAVGSLLTIC